MNTFYITNLIGFVIVAKWIYREVRILYPNRTLHGVNQWYAATLT